MDAYAAWARPAPPPREGACKPRLRHGAAQDQEDPAELDRHTGSPCPRGRPILPTLRPPVWAHWSVENTFHWVLDVTFREDECRTRKGYAARTLAMIRRAVLTLLLR